MKKYKIYGLLPMTRDQLIAYLKNSRELTKVKGGYTLTGGVPYINKNGEMKYRYPIYKNYDHYFKKMIEEGVITEAYPNFRRKMAN